MVRKKLESHIRKRFKMNLCEFIRNKVENEKLYDYEIARLLNVSGRLISNLRCFCNTRGDGFTRRFERRNGEGAVERFKKLIEDPDLSLSDVSNAFGFSREYARQVCRKIYGRPYTEIYKKKRARKKEAQAADRMRGSKRLGSLMAVKKKMESLGIPSQIKSEGRKYRLVTNGYKVVLKSSARPTRIGRKEYFRINYTGLDDRDCDFFICLCGDQAEKVHYVIPREALPKCTISLLPQAGPEESKYARFKEAWHLLRHGESSRMSA